MAFAPLAAPGMSRGAGGGAVALSRPCTRGAASEGHRERDRCALAARSNRKRRDRASARRVGSLVRRLLRNAGRFHATGRGAVPVVRPTDGRHDVEGGRSGGQGLSTGACMRLHPGVVKRRMDWRLTSPCCRAGSSCSCGLASGSFAISQRPQPVRAGADVGLDFGQSGSRRVRAVSSVGRASRLHREGRRFEPVTAHHASRRSGDAGHGRRSTRS